LDFSENTSDVTLITYQLSRFDIIIDDTIKLKVIGHPSWGRCIIKNVPKGKHTFVVVQNRSWANRENYKYESTVLSTGNREEIVVKLPVERYNYNSNNSELQLVLVALAGLGYLMKLVFL
jgi:hypothetical protein